MEAGGNKLHAVEELALSFPLLYLCNHSDEITECSVPKPPMLFHLH